MFEVMVEVPLQIMGHTPCNTCGQAGRGTITPVRRQAEVP